MLARQPDFLYCCIKTKKKAFKVTFIDCSPGSHVPLESAMRSALVISEDGGQGKISEV